MDSTSPRFQENHRTPLHVPSPHTPNSYNNNNSSNGLLHSQPQQQQGPKPITRSESGNPYPTTFVQADTSSFKQVVQMLTGSSETAKQASKPGNPTHNHNIPPMKSTPKKQQSQSGFKLYERRNSLLKNKKLHINPLMPVFSPRQPEILSPSILDFPSLVLSPVTPLIPDPFHPHKSIKEKGFFFHPSPASTPRDAEPRLLPLFPTTSPTASSSPSSSPAS